MRTGQLDSHPGTGHPDAMVLALLVLLAAPVEAPVADVRTLREADLALARTVEESDRAAFGASLADDACFLGGGEPSKGRAAVLAGWSSFFEKEGPRLRWQPELAEMARSADLGYTIGRWESETRDADGRTVKSEGRYVTVWRKEADGRFRVAADAPLLPPGPDQPPDLKRTLERKISSRAGDLVVEVGVFRGEGASPPRGAYLVIRRRLRNGALAAALETLVPAARPGAD
jgi:ketosteroid isomerase-like protein